MNNYSQQIIQEKFNCRLRIKSTKDGRITAIYKNKNTDQKEAFDVLKNAINADLDNVIIAGFKTDGTSYFDFYATNNSHLAMMNRNINFCIENSYA